MTDTTRVLTRLISEFEALRSISPDMQVDMGLAILRAALSREPAAGGAVGENFTDGEIELLETLARNPKAASAANLAYVWYRLPHFISHIRATAAPDESRELALIAFIDNDLPRLVRESNEDPYIELLDAKQILAAFNESRKR